MRTLVSVLWLILGGVVEAQAVWVLSDALGSDRGPAPRAAASAGSWVLRIEPRAGGEERTLFHNGDQDSVRLVDRDAQGRVTRFRDLRDGRPIWEVTFDPETGLPRTETTFRNSQPAETATLEFRRGLLSRRTVRDAEGVLLFTDTLGHWPDGTLRRLERDGPDGPLAEAAWEYGASGRRVRAWTTDEEIRPRGEHREWVYRDGQTEETLMAGTEALWTRVTDWVAVGGSQESRTETAGGRVELRTLDAEGRPQKAVISVKDVVVEIRRWTYDTQGRVLEMVSEAGGSLEVWAYRYEDAGTVTATLSRDGLRVREDLTQDGETQSVRLYDRGELFLVETWERGRRVKETYYQNGAVTRERIP